ncbi:uncharacterized protein PHACADRAFT_253476 [Phanerochaete carnosa HHB-10118-sp]|uniref:Phosphatidic acid phosphatase type 2/haloperoxidase domain-containing protein n=1 Tax=Phanerochaete carnosa (strain HHB-10118-sp) TaxID=650164 RepID=K5WB18_PHACS|nr:uncharacterized protein PHACADRAFT_253476 [Phanerochaete carnosa HHB-10118-sp]EKM56390.1 hypothetical protein PHACADRAFT_253476 [Phanerochaete carnosa HHB-10118-sp]
MNPDSRRGVFPHPRTSSTNSSGSSEEAYETETTPEIPVAVRPAGLAKIWDEKGEHAAGEDVEVAPGSIGIAPDEVYERTLSWWRVALRKRLVRSLVWESKVIAAMQERVRTPFFDMYFVNTSTLGTHTFFMTMLPSLMFFGYGDIAHGLIFVLALGVYASSVIKDLMCSPRPFAPPVTRITISTHHLEYGFPSTHSTNSVSIALFFFAIVHRLYKTPAAVLSPPVSPSNPLTLSTTHVVEDTLPQAMISTTVYVMSVILLVIYCFSIVYGRLYTGMHSFADCAFGVFLGSAIWGLYALIGDILNEWLRTPGWSVPVVVISTGLFLVHRHPEPVEDCPCFEDAIAFMAVVMGEFLTQWYTANYGFDKGFFVHSMPGKITGTPSEMWAWWSIAVTKTVIGILAIFAWRMFAKFLLHRTLPPTFRFLGQLMTLPHRRFYTPATDYQRVPSEKGLHPIPSVLDLPSMLELEVDGVSTAPAAGKSNKQGLKLRAGRGGKAEKVTTSGREEIGLGLEELGGKDVEVKHYDADVLTKVFVYCGIGILSSGVMPVVFEVIGWGL